MIFLLINRAVLIYGIILSKIINSMVDNQYDIDSAMNMIKEDVIRELSECVVRQNKTSYFSHSSSKNFSFSDKHLD